MLVHPNILLNHAYILLGEIRQIKIVDWRRDPEVCACSREMHQDSHRLDGQLQVKFASSRCENEDEFKHVEAAVQGNSCYMWNETEDDNFAFFETDSIIINW